jgi:hypothetical protein
MSWEAMDLCLINGGKAVHDVNHHLGEAIKDILDMNKPAVNMRRVTLTIKLVPTEDRQQAAIEYTVETKFPSETPGVDMIGIQRETKRGFLNKSEQLPIDFDPITGEVSPMIRTEKTND